MDGLNEPSLNTILKTSLLVPIQILVTLISLLALPQWKKLKFDRYEPKIRIYPYYHKTRRSVSKPKPGVFEKLRAFIQLFKNAHALSSKLKFVFFVVF